MIKIYFFLFFGCYFASAAPNINISDVAVEERSPGIFNVQLAAEAEGIELGSFFVRVEKRPEGEQLPGFYHLPSRSGNTPVVLEMLKGERAYDGRFYLMDNGSIDEDPRPGFFAFTFETEGWQEGEYVFRVGASNRPSEDAQFISDYRFASFVVGDADRIVGGSNIPSAKHYVVYKEPGVYAVFPRLYILPDGRMAVSFGTRVSRSHIDSTGGSKTLVTNDEGLTWEPLNSPLIDGRWLTDEGALVVAEYIGWIYTDSSREAELMEEKKVIHSRATNTGKIAYMGGARVRRSSDGGRSWEYEDIELPENLRGLGGYSKRASEIITSKGTRLVAVTGLRVPEDGIVTYPGNDTTHEVYFLRSDDDGLSWTCYPMVPEGLPKGSSGLNETALVETHDGLLIAMSRSQEGDGYLYQSESADDGLTWTVPEKTEIWGFPAHVLALDEDTLICAYGYRREPMGIRAVMSYDNGMTWDMDNELILRSDALGNPGDNGMPLLHQLSDGRIFAIYYITGIEGITHIASTIFEPKIEK